MTLTTSATGPKTYMFQYAYDAGIYTKSFSSSDTHIVENTDLITKEEAEALWNKYYDEVADRIADGQRPQMCIWSDCTHVTDYHTALKEIDWRDDLEVKNGVIFRISKEAL